MTILLLHVALGIGLYLYGRGVTIIPNEKWGVAHAGNFCLLNEDKSLCFIPLFSNSRWGSKWPIIPLGQQVHLVVEGAVHGYHPETGRLYPVIVTPLDWITVNTWGGLRAG